jgi:predicted DsbA family dithiol-disulfide isomerase
MAEETTTDPADTTNDTNGPMKVLVISDYVCPWCYIASERVAAFTAEFDVEVTWWPYELHPETPPAGRHVDELLGATERAEAARTMIKELAAAAGLPMQSNRWVANSRQALALAEFARDQGKFDCVHKALFAAVFAESKNIGDPDVLLEIATNCGLDIGQWQAEADDYAGLIARTTNMARQQGFTSTPTIIFNDEMMVPGAQDIEVYRDVLQRLGAKRR